MDGEKNKPAIIAAWNGVNFYKESGDDRADYPFEKYAKDAGACGVGYCYNFFPPFARAMPTNSTQPLMDSPKMAWGISAFLMGYAYKDAGGVLHFHLRDAGYKSVAEMFKAYEAAARRVRNEFSTVGVNPNVWGGMAKILARNKQWQERHGADEAAALERTRHADHGAAGELWAAVEPIADKYVAWVKGGCTVDDNFLPVLDDMAADEAAPVPVVAVAEKEEKAGATPRRAEYSELLTTIFRGDAGTLAKFMANIKGLKGAAVVAHVEALMELKLLRDDLVLTPLWQEISAVQKIGTIQNWAAAFNVRGARRKAKIISIKELYKIDM